MNNQELAEQIHNAAAYVGNHGGIVDDITNAIKELLDEHRPEPTKPKVVQFQEDEDGCITALMDNGEFWQLVSAGEWKHLEGPGESDEG